MEGNAEFQKLPQRQLKPGGQTLEVPEADWLKGIKDRFNRVFKRDKRVGESEIELNIVKNRHRSSEETKGMEDQFKKADIYIPEVFGWTQDYLNDLRRLSSGDVTPDEILKKMGEKNPLYYARDESLFNLIHRTNKYITIIDVPENHPLVRREEEIKFPKLKFGTDFGQSLNSVRECIKEFAAMQQEREAYMLAQLRPQIQELINTHRELRKKQNINVLMSVGVAHLQLSHKLKNQYKTTKEFSTTPSLFLYKEMAIIKYMFGLPVEDELIARIIAEQLLSKDQKNFLLQMIQCRMLDQLENWFQGLVLTN